MNLFFSAVTAFFAVIGLFETVWQAVLFVTRKSLRCRKIRIFLQPEGEILPELLTENLRILSDRFSCRDTEIRIITNTKDNRTEDFSFSRITPKDAARKIEEDFTEGETELSEEDFAKREEAPAEDALIPEEPSQISGSDESDS